MNGAAAPARRIVLDAATGLRHELAEMRPTGQRGSNCTATALAVASATILALACHVDDPWWAATSGFMCSQATAPASVQKGILRILGTIAGASTAMLLSPWLAADVVALSLALTVMSTAGVLGQSVSRYGYAWLLGAITADMVLMALLSDPASALTVTATVVALLMGAEAAPVTAAAGWLDLLDNCGRRYGTRCRLGSR